VPCERIRTAGSAFDCAWQAPVVSEFELEKARVLTTLD
jgi:hypothetical protein